MEKKIIKVNNTASEIALTITVQTGYIATTSHLDEVAARSLHAELGEVLGVEQKQQLQSILTAIDGMEYDGLQAHIMQGIYATVTNLLMSLPNPPKDI